MKPLLIFINNPLFVFPNLFY